MTLRPDTLPTWSDPASVAEARAIQQALRERLRIADDFGTPRRVAGVDVGYDPAAGTARASVVVLDLETLAPLGEAAAVRPTAFPYVPGYLSFREIPAVLEALAMLSRPPDLLLVDGQGTAHPRRMGIAAHLGLVTDIPAIGVGKSWLWGRFEMPGPNKGDSTPLMDRTERIGTVLRSRDGIAPLFVSPGHRVGHDSAVALVMACLTRYRLPEPTRLADKLSKFRRETPREPAPDLFGE